MANLPYVTSVGTLTKMLGKIKTAAVPPAFSTKFVSETLLMRGGTPGAVAPFLKKMGFVADNGTPTDLYRQFRNDRKSGQSIAVSMKILYAPLFAMNENVHMLSDAELRGMIVEATGGKKDSQVTKLTLNTFNALKKLADFSADPGEPMAEPTTEPEGKDSSRDLSDESPYGAIAHRYAQESEQINLSYTINLNLPATTDTEVFNAIFKSLQEHLLRR